MDSPIFTLLDGRIPIARHEHVAVFYRGRESAFRFLSFLTDGLERGELCRYLAPRACHAEMLAQLRARISDADRFLRSGKLRLHEGPEGKLDLEDWTKEVFEETERVGAPALRWLEEGTLPQMAGLSMSRYFEIHALLNYRVKQFRSVALCRYDLERLEPSHLFSAIAVHRHLIVEETLVRDNPFYIPAEKFIPMSPNDRERDLAELFRESGFDVDKLLAAIAGFGRLQSDPFRA